MSREVAKENQKESIHNLTQAEVARKFRVTESTVKNWRKKGLLQYLRVPRSTRVLYPADSVTELEKNSLHREKEVIRPKKVKRERPEISPNSRKYGGYDGQRQESPRAFARQHPGTLESSL